MNHLTPRILLIGGTSHAGKSTLARNLGKTLGWKLVSTDHLARHPGRPWKALPEQVPGHVAAHYLSLSANQLLADVLRHYQSLWPIISDLIVHSDAPLIVEGSALWPEWTAGLAPDNVTALWLTASDESLKQRIREASGYDKAVGEQKEMIRKFVVRTLLYNRMMMEAVHRLELPSVSVEHHTLKTSTGECLRLLKTS